LAFALAALAACSQPQMRSFTGSAQGEYVQVSVPLSGSLARLNVRRGEAVRQGEALFSLDSRADAAAQREATDRVRAAQAELRVARTSARPDDIRAAQSAVDVAQARLTQLQWRVEQATAVAPHDGVIVDIPFSEGQWVEAGAAVVSLLSPESVKVRFFVPAHVAATLHHGQVVALRCAGCEATEGEIVYVSPIAEAEQDGSSDRLRFLVEARPGRGAAPSLHPGRAIEVIL
jgi:HlyD family secretion protein